MTGIRRLSTIWGRAALVVAGTMAAVAVLAKGEAPTPSGERLARPDVATWPTLGMTARTAGMDAPQPAQFRQVQMESNGYRHFVKSGAFADGTMFSVKFYAVKFDKSQSPPLYFAGDQTAFAAEVIDRKHPDGRRFYLFAGTDQSATALPAGNECAQCHKQHGTLDGTFAHLYPLTANRVRTTPG